jgi:pimeloyl-ACP methyl ester carboxylesterase
MQRRAKSGGFITSGMRRVSSMFDNHPFSIGSFEVDGLRLFYEIHGSGPRTLVFLHGILLDAQMNRHLADDLAEHGYRVVLLDLPGHGLSDKPRHASAHRMDSYAQYVVDLLDELGIEEAAIGGVSLGANVALQVAVRAPSRVKGLVVEMPVLEWAVPVAALVFVPVLLGVHYAAPLARALAWVAHRIPKSRVGPLDSVVTTLSLQPEEVAAVLHGVLIGPIAPTYEERHAIEAPALILGHKIDFLHPFADADHLTRQLPNARLLEANSILELRVSPERLTAEVAAFLDQIWGLSPLRRLAHSPRDQAAKEA